VNFKQKRYFSFLILTISICYSLFGNYPNNYGDPLNYLSIANSIGDANLMRFPGYPLFIKVFSLNLYFLFLPPIFQVCIFIFSITLLENEVSKSFKKSYLIYLLMAFPDITYLHILMFPDSLILSMLCLYVYFLIKNNFLFLFLISIILLSLKSYLIFIIIFTLIIFLEKKITLISDYKIKYFYSIIFPFFFYIFLPNHLVQPFFSKINTEVLKINIQEKCDMENINVTEEDIFLNKKDIQFGAILLKKFSQKCHKNLEKKISRIIINQIVTSHYDEIIINTISNFFSSFSGIGNNDHITSMIKADLLNKIRLIKEDQFKFLNINDFTNIKYKTISPYIINSNTLIDKFNLFHIMILNNLQILASFLIMLLSTFFFFKNKKVELSNNLMAININFSLMHCFFGINIPDRYLFYVLIFNLIIISTFASFKKKKLKVKFN
jgi:hypothetical protein